MNPLAVSAIVFAFVFGGALLGIFLRSILPEDHLSSESKSVVMMSMGLVATMTAIVLGLLISSAKGSFDALSNEMTATSTKIILLDRSLAEFGPETKDARELLRGIVGNVIERMDGQRVSDTRNLAVPAHQMELIYKQIQGLQPKDEQQRARQASALGILSDIRQTRWLMYEQQAIGISVPMLVIVVSWLAALFISFGLHAPWNATVVVALAIAAFAVSCAILLILELYSPQRGLIRIGSSVLRAAYAQLGN